MTLIRLNGKEQDYNEDTIRNKNMKTTFCIILSFLTCLQINQCKFANKPKEEKIEDILTIKNSIKLRFNLIAKEVKSYKGYGLEETEIVAEIRHTNLSREDLKIDKQLFVGSEKGGDNFIEAFDFQENKIEIEKDVDYQIIFDMYLEKANLKTNESKVDTINLSTFYAFKQKGNYKVRFVNKELNLISNWDTLIVN